MRLYTKPAYAWYVVVLLTLAYVVSYMDRQILALVVGPIKRDLGLSDTQIGLLLGPAFAIFYTTLGVPLGWLADRKSRRALIGIGITLWCAATAASGLARNFLQLFAARVAVGVGEATLNPSALSLISDYFPPGRRARAIAVYTMAISLGGGIAYLIGGQVVVWAGSVATIHVPGIGALRPWQIAFVAVGLPGLLIALLMFTVREPARTGQRRLDGNDGGSSFLVTIRYLRSRWKVYGSLFSCMCMVTILAYGHFWLPTLFERTWGWDIATVTLYMGFGLLLFGPPSNLFGGWLADRLVARGRRDGPVIVAVAGVLIMMLASVIYPLMPSGLLAFIFVVVFNAGAAVTSVTIPVAVLNISPGQMRAQTIAIYYLCINLTGLFLGPTSVAFFTDNVFKDEAAIRYSMVLVPVVFGVFGIIPVLFARKQYLQALDEAEAAELV